jgi:hypothetical protein
MGDGLISGWDSILCCLLRLLWYSTVDNPTTDTKTYLNYWENTNCGSKICLVIYVISSYKDNTTNSC